MNIPMKNEKGWQKNMLKLLSNKTTSTTSKILETLVILLVSISLFGDSVGIRAAQAKTTKTNLEPIGTFQLQAPCFNPVSLESIMNQYQESVVANGVLLRNNTHTNKIIIFVNSVTRTWTVVEQITTDVYCVLATGSEFNVIKEPIQPTVPKKSPKQDTINTFSTSEGNN